MIIVDGDKGVQLKNLKVGRKLNTISLVVVLLLGIVAVISYAGMATLKDNYKESNNISNLSINITKTSEQGLQVSNALRGMIVNPDDKKATENFIKAIDELDDLINVIKLEKKAFDKFNIEQLYSEQLKELNRIKEKVKNGEEIIASDNSKSTAKWRELKKSLLAWQEENLNRNKEMSLLFEDKILDTTILIVGFLLATILSIFFAISLISRNIVKSLNALKDGLDSFFLYLNNTDNSIDLIKINSKDEFGEMAKVVNKNISTIQENMIIDNNLMTELKLTSEKAMNGFFVYEASGEGSNKNLNDLRTNLNELMRKLRTNFEVVNDLLHYYSKQDFTYKRDYSDINGDMGTALGFIRLLSDNTSNLLAMITKGIK